MATSSATTISILRCPEPARAVPPRCWCRLSNRWVVLPILSATPSRAAEREALRAAARSEFARPERLRERLIASLVPVVAMRGPQSEAVRMCWRMRGESVLREPGRYAGGHGAPELRPVSVPTSSGHGGGLRSRPGCSGCVGEGCVLSCHALSPKGEGPARTAAAVVTFRGPWPASRATPARSTETKARTAKADRWVISPILRRSGGRGPGRRLPPAGGPQ